MFCLLTAAVFLVLICFLISPNRNIKTSAFAEHQKDDSFALKDSVRSVLSIAAVGDVMLESAALPLILEHGPDYPFVETRKILESADVAVANLEAPFTLTGEAFHKTFTFRAPPEFSAGIRNAGFDVLTLANNHILDFGPQALYSTLNLLDSLGLAHCGAGRNLAEAEKEALVQRSGWTVAFLAYSMTYPEQFWATPTRCGTVYPRKPEMRKRIAEAAQSADLVVVCFHWGRELAEHPQPYQREFARLAVDCGADLVIGHHPHVLQGIELYKKKPIAYSLGNFVFGSYSGACRESVILKAYFSEDGFRYAELVPVSVYNREVEFQPKALTGDRRNQVFRSLNRISKELNRGREIISETGMVKVDEP